MPTPYSPLHLRSLFERALALPCDERDAFLKRACAADEELRREVEQLLAADARRSGFLDRSPSLAASSEGFVGQTLGNYRIERLLAAGGMSVVFEATQREPKRSVALKVLHGPFPTAERIARFRLEADLLARLDHPGIARILEAGSATIGGQPILYLSLELVPDALPITEYASRHQLGREARLRLFRAVCAAVAAGHEQGVVHRDLKPGNLLVDGQGCVKVIDFGIARAVESDPKLAAPLTATGEFVGTLRYMSPEQLLGRRDAVDARTDVWSLGVVLFEILSGAFPFDLGGLSPAGVARALAEHEPRRLSSRDPSLRGDLEIIVERALARVPADRYGSVEQLGLEIDRFLTGAPIAARADHTLYVLRRRAIRHRRLLFTAAAMLALATSAALVMGFLWRQSLRAQSLSARSLYRNQIAVASSALQAGRIAEMKRALERCEPAWRGWEWGHLHARSDDSDWTATHGGSPLTAIAVSRDGLRVASSSRDGRIRAWDAGAGTAVAALDGHSHIVDALAFDPRDERRLFSAGRDRTVREWDVDDAREINRIALSDEPRALTIRSDGAELAIGRLGGGIEVRPRDGGAPLWTSLAHSGAILSLAYSLDGALLASGGWDTTVLLADARSGATVRRIDKAALRAENGVRDVTAHGGYVTGLTFDRSGRFLFTSCDDGVGKMWLVETGELRHYTFFPGRLGPIVSSPDGMWLALPCEGQIHLTSTVDAAAPDPLKGHDLTVAQVAFSPDSKRLYSASQDGTLKAFDLAARGGAAVIGEHESRGLFHIGRSWDGSVLASADELGFVKLWDTDSLRCAATLRPHLARIRAVALNEDGSRFVTGSDDRTIRLSDAATGTAIATTDAPGRPFVIWTRAGIVVSGESERLVLLDASTLATHAVATTPGEMHVHTHASPDGQLVAIASASGMVRVRGLTDLSLIDEWKAHDDGVCFVQFLSAQLLASGGKDRTVRIWSIPEATLVTELEVDGQPVGIAATKNSDRLLVMTMRGNPTVWSLESGEALAELSGHATSAIRRTLVALDDGRFVTSDSAGVLRIWSDTRAVRR